MPGMIGRGLRHLRKSWLRAPRCFVVAAAAGCVILSGVGPAAAAYPDRAVKIIVGSAAGSAVDVIARLFGYHLSELWKQPVVVENRAGANGQIAARAVAQSSADGYTLLLSTAATLTTNPVFFPEAGAFVLDQLDPVTVLVSNDFAIAVRPTMNVKTVSEFIDFTKKSPSPLNVATSVQGGTAYLAAELFKRRAHIDYSVIPHNGGGAAINSILGGHTDAILESLTLTAPLVESGHLVLLATTGSVRSEFTPGLPTLVESGFPDFKVSGWLGLLGPKGMAPEIITQIRNDLLKIAKNKAILDQVGKIKMYTVLNTSDEFRKTWKDEVEVWRDLALKLKPN